MKKVLLFTLFALWVSPTLAAEEFGNFFSGSRMHKLCASSGYEGGMCTGYILGAVDAAQGEVVCVPSGVQLPQFIAIVKKHLVENPQGHQLPGTFAVWNALREYYPCK